MKTQSLKQREALRDGMKPWKLASQRPRPSHNGSGDPPTETRETALRAPPRHHVARGSATASRPCRRSTADAPRAPKREAEHRRAHSHTALLQGHPHPGKGGVVTGDCSRAVGKSPAINASVLPTAWPHSMCEGTVLTLAFQGLSIRSSCLGCLI